MESSILQKCKDLGIVCYAFQNRKYRYYLPGKKNLFGFAQCERVVLDTGCYTTLVPFPSEQNLEEVFQYISGKYCSISYPTETFNTLALIVESARNNKMDLEFESSSRIFEVTKLKFYLSYEDAVRVLSEEKIPLRNEDIEKLRQFVKDTEALKSASPAGEFGKKRNNALIGQDILKNFVVVQDGWVTALFDKRSMKSDFVSLDSLFIGELQKLKVKDPEFDEIKEYENEEEEPDWKEQEYIDEPND